MNHIPKLKYDIFGDIFNTVTTGLGINPQARLESEARDRQEANNWDMYQTQRSDAKSAIQDRVADMKKAGINPILAAGGQGAQIASGSSSVGGVSPSNPATDLLGSLQTLANVRKTNAEADTLQPKAHGMRTIDKILNKLENSIQGNIDTLKAEHENGSQENMGFSSGPKQSDRNYGEDYSRDYFRSPEKQIYHKGKK